MTGPRPVADDFDAYLQKHGGGGADPFADYLTKHGRRNGDKPRGFRTEAQIKRLNKADADEAKDADAADTYANRLGSMAERGASVLPGGSAALTGARYLTKKAIGEDETWEEAARANAEGAEEGGKNAPGVTIPEAIPLIGGSRITLADAPAAAAGFRAIMRTGGGRLSAPLASAMQAGSTRLLDPVPQSLGDRAKGTALSTALGYAIPKVMEGGATLTAKAGNAASRGSDAVRRSLRPLQAWKESRKALTHDDNVSARAEARDVAADPLFDAFRASGDLGRSKDLSNVIGSAKRPGTGIVEEAIRQVRKLNTTMRDAKATDAEFLSEVSKRVGSKAWRDEYGFASGEGAAELVNAIEPLANKKGVSLKAANEAYSVPSGEMDAVTRGFRTQQYAGAPKGAPPQEALGNSPAQLPKWLATATDAEKQAVAEGILARLQVEPKLQRFNIPVLNRIPLPVPTKALRAAPRLLDQVRGVQHGPKAPNALQRAPQTLQDLIDLLAGKP